MAELGFFGLTLPEAYGGSDAGTLSFAVVLEELGRADQSVAVTVSVSGSLAGGMIAALGHRRAEGALAPRPAPREPPSPRSP